MSPRLRWLLGTGLLVLVLAGAGWFSLAYEQVPEKVPVPPRGEPTYNPFYALRQALRIDGVQAESRRRLDLEQMQLQPGDTVVLLQDPQYLSAMEVQGLLDWVARGGHLVIRVPWVLDRGQPRKHGLLSRLGILPGKTLICLPLELPGKDPHTEFCHGTGFHLDHSVEAELTWGRSATSRSARRMAPPPVGTDLSSPEARAYMEDLRGAGGLGHARLRWSRGRVDVLAVMDFMLNNGNELRRHQTSPGVLVITSKGQGLRDPTHRILTRHVLAPNYGKGAFHLVYEAGSPSLASIVLRHGWAAWIPLLLALLAWLWARSQRFGPLLPAPRQERRSLLEHVSASGQHLLRYGKAPLLHEAVRRAFLARLQRRAPLAAALHGEAQVHAIAQRLQWPAARVAEALKTPASNDHAALRERIRLLIQMRNQL